MRINKSLIAYTPTSGAGSGSVTSVALSAPTGFTVSGSPITTSGTLALSFTTGYGIPPLMTGNSGKYLTTNGTTMSWVNIAGTDVTGAAISTSNDTNILITASGNTSNALLRTLTLTTGWTGQLAVGRGGTGASALSGVLIGNNTTPITGVTGIGGQILRANPSTGVYEFWTPTYMENPMNALGDLIYGNAAGAPLKLAANATSTNKFLRSVSGGAPSWQQITAADVSGLLTGSGTTNFVPIWTSSTALGSSALSITGGNANFGNNILVAGNSSATNGSIMLQDNYSSGHLGNIGTMFSGGNLMLGYCVTPSTSSATGFVSATGIDIPKSSIVVGTDIFFYTASSQAITIGSAVTMTERLKVSNNGQLKLGAYTSTSSFTGIAQGYLAFTSGGLIITTAAPGGVSGTQNYLAKFDSTGIAVGNSRIVDDGTNFLLNGASSVITGLNLVGNFSATESQGGSILLRRSAVPTSGQSLAIIDAYGITTGSTYQRGGGIEFRASQNWNSTSAGTEIAVSTAPDNTIAPADMFVFLNNGAVRFIGRTSNPIGAAAGTMYYNSSANEMRYYNGTSWISF